MATANTRAATSAHAPTWFTEAIAVAPRVGTVDAAGANIRYRVWGDSGPGVILVHGVAAHARWWDHLAPLLAVGRSVVALDLSGHGESDRRDQYSRETWSAEVVSIADHFQFDAPTVIGHSLGGMVALTAASRHVNRFGAVVAIESGIRPRQPALLTDPAVELQRPLRIYSTRSEAVDRWRPLPRDVEILPYIAEHIAATSVVSTEGGWSWKFDPQVFAAAAMPLEELGGVQSPVTLYRGEFGSVTLESQCAVLDRLGDSATGLRILGAGHNIMLDSPVALAAALETLLALTN